MIIQLHDRLICLSMVTEIRRDSELSFVITYIGGHKEYIQFYHESNPKMEANDYLKEWNDKRQTFIDGYNRLVNLFISINHTDTIYPKIDLGSISK